MAETVRLRALRVGDAPEIARLAASPRVARYMTFPDVDAETIAEWIRNAELGGDGDAQRYLWWGVELKELGQFAGCGGLVMEPLSQSAEVWYMLDEPFWGRGFGGQAARLLIDVGFREKKLHRIWAHVAPANTASVRILESCGMRREGEIKKNLPIRGEWLDSYLYAILREEWQA